MWFILPAICLFLSLAFDSKDGCSMFLKTLLAIYWTTLGSIPEDGILQSHCWENLKSNKN
jgi:hypothetical protein